MADASDIRARAVLWREAAELTRGRAARVLATGSLRWDAPAAGAFRSRVGDRAAALRRLADLEDEVGTALDAVAQAVARGQGVLDSARASPPGWPPGASARDEP